MKHLTNLTQRLITAFILIGLFIFLIFKASIILFIGIIFIIGLLAIWELWRLIQSNHSNNRVVLITMVAIYSVLVFQFYTNPIWINILWATGLIHSLVTGYVLYFQPNLRKKGTAIYGSIVLSVVMYSIVILQKHNSFVLLSAMGLVWIADIGGYFIGRYFGKKIFKVGLAPHISPKKTWEGAIGGTLLATLIMILAYYFSVDTWLIQYKQLYLLQTNFIFNVKYQWFIGCIPLILAAYSVTGDLLESLLKRQAGVKDSSQLLPGHGGILDRIDALIPILPLCAMWVTWTHF